MVQACHTPQQPLQNHPSGHLRGWVTLWLAKDMLHGQHQRVDIPATYLIILLLLCLSVWFHNITSHYACSKRKVDMQFLTCAMISVHAMHVKARQALTNVYTSQLGRAEECPFTMSRLQVEPTVSCCYWITSRVQ